MKMDFDYDSVNALSNALGKRIEIIEKLFADNGFTPEMAKIIGESDYRKDLIPMYGFHIDSNESDPSAAVTYLADAVGMTPAYMDYEAGEFNYGSWENAFFMPRPCMLKYDGTVDYYLDPNDYSKKEDGTDSDVADFEYEGNAMMEWGRDGHQIWYKIVPDEDDNTSASVYFSEYQLDDGFHAWSFINNQGKLVEHFYTPIYNGTLDGDGKLRSISGKENTDLAVETNFTQEIAAAELNNPGEDKLWYTETFADVTLINLLLVLIGKSLNGQNVFGNGVSNASNTMGSGTTNDKGLFFGANDMTTCVKVFGMEHWWGNIERVISGLNIINGEFKYKLTRGSVDGSEANDYNINGENYIASNVFNTSESTMGWITNFIYNSDGSMLYDPNAYNGNGENYYTDQFLTSKATTGPAQRGGMFVLGVKNGPFHFNMQVTSSGGPNNIYTGPSLSCKPLAPEE